MKTILLNSILICSPYLFSQTTLIPDPIFEQALINQSIDSDGVLNGQINTSDAASVTNLFIQDLGIDDLTGIQAFVSLEHLVCYNNDLTSLDLSQNGNLIYLECNENNLTSLDLSGNPELGLVVCYSNNLPALDVSSNLKLYALRCSNNMLTDLQLGQKDSLTIVECDYNELTSLNLSQAPKLSVLSCSGNQLTQLNVSANLLLQSLSCDENNLTILDIGLNTEIYQFSCSFNNLYSLNVQNGNNNYFDWFSATNNPNLTCIQVDQVSYSDFFWSDDIDAQSFFSTFCGLAVNEENSRDFTIYPNPIVNQATILIDFASTYFLTDIDGRVVNEGVLSPGLNSLDLESVSVGLYFINIKSDEGIWTKKVIIE